MPRQNSTDIRPTTGRPYTGPRVLLPIKMHPDLRKRFKLKAVEQDLTYAELIEKWMDEEDRRLEQSRRAQAHPLHRPGPASIYPGGGGNAGVGTPFGAGRGGPIAGGGGRG
ncbi:ribbon-helix-helix DNA binding domain protein [Mycobacterium phage Funsized]|nr:ribbon-helix-helix DNA binding domain protein [Mycobacterium phage Funsized]